MPWPIDTNPRSVPEPLLIWQTGGENTQSVPAAAQDPAHSIVIDPLFKNDQL